MATLSPVESRQVEQDYALHREEIMGMLRSGFARMPLPDREELYQEAWAEVLELHADGKPVGDLRMLLRTIAWRRGADRIRDQRADPFDPKSRVFGVRANAPAQPDEEAQIHLDAAIARHIVNGLDGRHQLVIKLRFEAGMSSLEIQEHLGITAKRLEKIVTEAYHRIDALLDPVNGGESPYRRRQRSLLLACLLGQASAAQLDRARHMVAEDPGCRAILRQMHFTMDRVAVIAPAPLIVDGDADHRIPILDRISHWLTSLKQFVVNLLSSGDARMSTEQVAGGAATVGGAGIVAKVALTCIAVGATAVCLSGTTHPAAPRPFHRRAPTPKRSLPVQRRHRLVIPSPPVTPAPPVAAAPTVARPPVSPAAPVHHRTHVTHHHHHHVAKTKKPKPQSQAQPPPVQYTPPPVVTAASAPPQPLPAPQKSTQFGPGNVGSHAASTKPAAAPTGGGGEFLP